jgi:hypothetical protein
LRNVTSSTIAWYETAFKALERTHGAEPPLTRTALHAFVVDPRQRGVKPISCNTYIKALNAFCKWLHDEGHAPDRLELQTLNLETRILQTLTDAQVQTLLAAKPKTFDRRQKNCNRETTNRAPSQELTTGAPDYASITGMSYWWVIATRSRASFGRAVSDRLAPQMQLTVTEQSDGPLVQPTL